MKLKYAGPKEIISAHGVSFKRGKDDKYVYIYPSFQIYNAIHHDYEKNKIYSHNIEGKRLDDEELLEKLFTLRTDFKSNLQDQIYDLENYLNNELDSVQNHKEYTDEEKRVFKNNLVIMRPYRKQRETNKLVYNKLIEIIVDDIIEHKLKEISAPFNERYWHIFQTLQGELSHHDKRSIASKLDIIHGEEALTIILKISTGGLK